MRRYTDDEEERIHLQGEVREWTRSGLLDAAQGEALAAELRVDLRRTKPFLRAVLALFTALIVAKAMIEVTLLPNDVVLPALKVFPIANGFTHRFAPRERKQSVQMIWHEKEECDVPTR